MNYYYYHLYIFKYWCEFETNKVVYFFYNNNNDDNKSNKQTNGYHTSRWTFNLN